MSPVFKAIALCFSGGGYRASCYTFGCLSFLEKINLLEHVKALSTVSGGTITGGKYVQSLIEHQSFDQFYLEYYNWLKEDTLTENVIKHIKSYKVWKQPENKHKHKNPINALAIEYNKLTNNRTLGHFQNHKTHLERISFNTTDFTYATQFRFQNIDKSGRVFGHKFLKPEYRNLEDQIKIGDCIAASSAFPGGFEPIAFPSDFVPNTNHIETIGLMDGGIVDNQGASVFLTTKEDANPYSLFFINDVSSPYVNKDKNETFKFAETSKLSKVLTILSNPILLVGFILLSIFAFIKNWWLLYSIFLIISTFQLVIQLGLLMLSIKIGKLTNLTETFKVAPHRLGKYLINRLNSLLIMSGVVMLKNDRRQNASKLYNSYNEIAITSAIYELRCKDSDKPEFALEWEKIKPYTNDISENIKTIANRCASFGTNLWFDRKAKSNNMLDQLIACGEFTTCYNLIAYLVRFHEDKIKGKDAELTAIFNLLLEYWEQFQANPLWLVKERYTN
ncbi:patatin-like phospholipase family protein [Olleya sp. YS]|uniref:patatin-like phospholipase family protein n=1 Tax=Olleya sp. YS TaxID=3028318 RepID=UPI0024345FD3|nr:patatin-like phospholipase family protein [Olleya sp. YS]WGD34748.1 patatin-like phospholipase family protein [Olleya sp. YS]